MITQILDMRSLAHTACSSWNNVASLAGRISRANGSISLRAACNADSDFHFQLYCDTRSAEVANFGWDPRLVRNFLLQQFTAKSAAYTPSYPDAADFIIVKDDTPIGRLLINESPTELRLVDIALLTSFQRRGIGSAILNALQSESSARQLPLTLSVQFDSPALALYQRHGFRLLPGHDGVYLQLIWEPAP